VRKITLVCEKSVPIFENKLSVHFQGWLMRQIDSQYADELHKSQLKPYTIHTTQNRGDLHFVITMLTEHSKDVISNVLLNNNFEQFSLDSSQQKTFIIKEKKVEEKSQRDLSNLFYQKESYYQFDITFESPTSFKSQGEYVFMPDVRLFFQSIMQKYNFIFEESTRIETDLLNELCEKTKIVNYRIESSYHPIHRTHIPGFKGTIKLSCDGNNTLLNYLSMLLSFADYSGVGIKTSMGMGALSTKGIKKGEKNGRKAN